MTFSPLVEPENDGRPLFLLQPEQRLRLLTVEEDGVCVQEGCTMNNIYMDPNPKVSELFFQCCGAGGVEIII